MSKEKLWSKTLVSLMAINFISALSFYLLMVKITEYTMQTYSVSYSVGASTVTAYVIAALAARLLLGRRIDEWGARLSLVIGLVINAVACAAYLIEMPLSALIVVRVVHGVGFALTSGAAAAAAALVIPASRRGEGIGYFSMMQALATGIGPFVAIALTDWTGGYKTLFAFTAVLCVAALVVAWLVDMPESEGFQAGKEEPAHPQRKGPLSLIQVSVLPLAATLFLIYIGYSSILSFVVMFAREQALSEAVSLYFVVYAAVILITRPPIGRRLDRKGENSCVYWSLGALVIGFVVLALAVNGAMMLASAALAGFGIGATQSVVQAVIARDTPPDELGRANSTFFMSMDLGSGIGPMCIGAFIPVVGYRAVYLAMAVLAAAAMATYALTHGRKAAKS